MEVSPYIKYDMLRPLNWRYERVRSLLDRPDGQPIGRCSPQDDKETRALRRFLIEYNRRSPATRGELVNHYPGLWYAFRLYQTEEEERLRHYVEARILARQSDQDIARAVGALPDMVKWYEACFYNVRDRFQAKDWIVRQIHGTAEDEDDHDVSNSFSTLKLFGYYCGPVTIDALISGFTHDRAPEDIKEVNEFCEDYVTATINIKSTMAARAMPVNSANTMQLLSIFAKLLDMKRSNTDGEGSLNSIEQNISNFWTELSPFVGNKKGRDSDNPLLIELDQEAVELRDFQLQGLHGATPEQVAELRKHVTSQEGLQPVKDDQDAEQK